jgi:hypothetical protein
MIILHIFCIVSFNTSQILILSTQPINGPDANLNIRTVNSITQAIANMVHYKRAAKHLVPRYENKICNADHASVLHESFAQPIMEHYSHSADAPRSINEHPVEEPYDAYLPTRTDDHQYTFDVNDASVSLIFPSIGADLQPDSTYEPVSTLWPHIVSLS